MVECTADPDEPQLPRFYAGREVLITGATGFMGKVLIERLLSTCPEVGRLHLLVRGKRGQSPDERLAHLKLSKVFDNIRVRRPSQLDKLVAVPGDVTETQLGLGTSAIAALKEVSVVFHNAATVKFSEPLRDAVSQNVLSAINVMDACDQLPALEVLVHVSTAFSNAELEHVEERVYETPVTLAGLLSLMETLTAEQLEEVTPKLVHPKPNTYIFTKALAEVAVAQRQRRNYSVTIFRPSIVVSSHRAPFPGWIEGSSGATGVAAGIAKGVLRVSHASVDGRADMVPVDVAIDNMIAVAWEMAMEKAGLRVQYCGSQERPLRWRQLRAGMLRAGLRAPADRVLYYPFVFGFKNRYVYKFLETVLQTIPLHLVEYISRICRINKSIDFIKVSQRLSAMSAVLGAIACHEWTFECGNMQRLREKLQRTDGHLFHLDVGDIDWQEHLSNFHRGTCRYILGQDERNLPRARAHMNRLRVIHYAVLLLLGWLCYRLCKAVAHSLALCNIY